MNNSNDIRRNESKVCKIKSPEPQNPKTPKPHCLNNKLKILKMRRYPQEIKSQENITPNAPNLTHRAPKLTERQKELFNVVFHESASLDLNE